MTSLPIRVGLWERVDMVVHISLHLWSLWGEIEDPMGEDVASSLGFGL